MSAYTRTTKKVALVPRTASVPYRSTYGVGSVGVPTLVAVPVFKVLRPIECDACRKTQDKGSFVLRERRWDYFRTTCMHCAQPVLPSALWNPDAASGGSPRA